jgi:putative methionine-R-sulfoxide reductase with GAF domain
VCCTATYSVPTFGAPEGRVEFTITAGNGDSVKVEAENWMVAMGRALAFLDVDIAASDRVVCTPAGDGGVLVEQIRPPPPADPRSMLDTDERPRHEDRSWTVRRVAPAIEVRVTPLSALERWEDAVPRVLREEPTDTEPGHRAAAAPLAMPDPTLHRDEPPESLAERLFDLSMDIAASDVGTACNLALDLILSLVPAEAASVARGTVDDPALVFVAARGPVADRILGREVRFGEGLLGMCFDMRGTLLVNDVAADLRHLDQFDRETGFETLAVLCVPILDHDGTGHGVVQLLNPPNRHFTPAHVEVVETTARTLASSLSSRR